MPTVKHLTAVQNFEPSDMGGSYSTSETIAVVIVDDEGGESLWIGDYSTPAACGIPDDPNDQRPVFRWMALPMPNIPGKPAQVFRLGPEPQRIVTVAAPPPGGNLEQ